VAEHFAITDRGTIGNGRFADIVVARLDAVAERATWRQPNHYPEGIEHVFVNGAEAVAGGQFTGVLSGRILAR
jgi:N-acyl-D-aspartate/D-glutamate deacylase